MNEIEKAESIIKLINDSDINTTFLFGWQIEFIEKLCRKQLNNGWIPVEERMPECGGSFLVTYSDDEIAIEFLQMNNDWLWEDIEKGTEVIAWQPLPEPYKPKED